jgi:hypothetical protein
MLRIFDRLGRLSRPWRYAVVAVVAFMVGGAAIVQAADPSHLFQLVNFAPNPDGSFNTAQVDGSHQLSVIDSGTQARLDTANRSLGQLKFDSGGNLQTAINAPVRVGNSSIPVTQSGGTWTTQSGDATTVIASGHLSAPANGISVPLVSDFDFTPYKEVQIYAVATGINAEVFVVSYDVSGATDVIDGGSFTNNKWAGSYGLLPPHTTIDVANPGPNTGDFFFTVLGRKN